jgi:hypothetical protein
MNLRNEMEEDAEEGNSMVIDPPKADVIRL